MSNAPDRPVVNVFVRAGVLALAVFAAGPLAAQQVGRAATLEELRTRAEAGHPWSQLYLGAAYENGINGAPRDTAVAARWYQLAASRGIPFAQYNLGLLYAAGDGVPQDDKLAFHWLSKAATKLADAQYLVGVAYAEGKGTDSSPMMARKWLAMAVDNGSERAAEYLARLP